jgi:hypothetical protein
MKIYISGMISNLSKAVYERSFNQAEQKLIASGHQVVNPLRIDHSRHDQSWESFMLADIKELFSCDGIFMLAGWNDSKGAMIERAIAQAMGKHVYYEGATCLYCLKNIFKHNDGIYYAYPDPALGERTPHEICFEHTALFRKNGLYRGFKTHQPMYQSLFGDSKSG